ncbi:hypothetical protein K469DRAFT_705329, partial [Zopfia rhizophila CBS 207.26]
MKLKLSNKGPEPAPAPTSDAPTSGPKLKFKPFSKPSTAPSDAPTEPQSAEAPKPKRKYTKKPKNDENDNPLPTAPKAPPKTKKRAREENGEDGSPAAKRKPKPTAKSQAMVHNDDDDEHIATRAPRQGIQRTQSMKLSFKKAIQGKGPQSIRLKGSHGRPPPRPPGVGYDSEAEDAEVDPALESQFILRMQPGPDCDALRKSIEEKTVGKTTSQGGPGVHFRFFDREGRRAMVKINDRYYAACMVDLPCVIESMKSWNKKDWVKTADVCQMLLVLGSVKNEDEARIYPLPREVDANTHQYPHGLTPPMHYARRRRFRPRVSYRRIEEVEETVDSLLEDDRSAIEAGGQSEYQVIDADKLDSEDESTESESENEMAEAPAFAEGETPAAMEMEEEDDEDEMAKMMEAELLASDDLFREPEPEPETPATSHDVAMHVLGETAVPTTENTPGSTSNQDTESADDDDDDGDSDEDVDDDALAAQQELAQQREDIATIEKEIETAWQQYHAHANVLFKRRQKAKIDSLTNDLKIKKAALGEDV